MSNYFRQVPDFEYVNRLPDSKISDYITVKNLFKKSFLREDIFQNLAVFKKYNIINNDRPDNVAFEVYGDANLDWLVLTCNNILNVYEEWPMTQINFENYLLEKYETYDNINAAHHYDSSNDWQHALEGVSYAQVSRYELKRKLFKAVANVNILEGIRFYVSFACSFAFGELKLMEGSAKIISLIARDENQHLAITQNILKKWREGDDPEMAQIFKEEEQWLIQTFEKTVNQEKLWAEYLFKDGSMIGLNDKLLQQYVEWIANRRMKSIGLKPIYDIPAKNNPLPWTEHWISSKGLQVAPQETEVESYIVGGIKQDVTEDTFAGFSL